MTWILTLLRSAVALFVARKIGASEQRAADQQAAQQETTHALETRAATDDQVARLPESAIDSGLSKWERPGSGS